jgi:hypothetical protein
MQHPTFSATVADQHRDELSRQASDARLARSRRPNGRSQWRAARWWRPATRPARA